MIINYSHGIVQKPASPKLLQFNKDFTLSIDSRSKNTIIAFADGDKTHLYSETEIKKKAWQINKDRKTKWLYWELDMDTGHIKYDYTTVSPEKQVGNVFPEKSKPKQHFFNTYENCMFVWTGSYWKKVLRVFAGKITGDGILVEYGEFSQNKTYKPTKAGHLLFDSNKKPIMSDGKFVNTADMITTPVRTHRPNLNTEYVTVSQPVPAYTAVTTIEDKSLLASNMNPAFPCIGLSINDMAKGETGRIVTSGHIVNDEWAWTKDDKIVFVGENGELTSRVPTKLSFQKVGFVTGTNSIYVDISPLIKIYSQALLRLLNKTSYADITEEDLLALQHITESLYQFVEFDSIPLTQPKEAWVF